MSDPWYVASGSYIIVLWKYVPVLTCTLLPIRLQKPELKTKPELYQSRLNMGASRMATMLTQYNAI